MSFITRFFQRLMFRPSRYIGQDLEGNLFYENPSSSNDPRRTKRTVQYRNPEDVWKYIGGGKRLAVQWSSWLSHTRRHPPTLEELQIDMARQQRVLTNVALIEARDRAEWAQVPGTQHTTPQEPLQDTSLAELPTARALKPVKKSQGNTADSGPKFTTTTETDEPQAWTPRARTRGK